MEISSILSTSQVTADSPRLKSLLSFLDRGWPLLPLHYPIGKDKCSCSKKDCSSAGKHPMTKHGLHDASLEESQILKWWRDVPNANVAIRTGVESGIVVLDIDPRHDAIHSLAELERQYGPLPTTLKVRTGGDGWHYYFLHPGVKVTNRVNILPGLDFRGDGGYIISPPSVHKTLRPYVWEDETQQIAPLPEWLLKILLHRPNSHHHVAHVAKVEKVEPSVKSQTRYFGEGSRNNSLLSLGGFLKSRGASVEEISQVLLTLNKSVCTPPLDDKQVLDISYYFRKFEEAAWPEKKELPQASETPELTLDMLPASLRNWCSDIAERMQVPLEFTAGPAIVMLASLIGRKAAIYPKKNDDWNVIPKLWGVLLAPPGSLKSPAISAVLKPLNNLATKAKERYLEEIKKKAAEETIAKTEIDGLKDALKIAIKQGKQSQIDEKKQQLAQALINYESKYTAKERRYITNDPTIEKLLTIVQDNPQGVLLYRDELSGWLETMYKSGREGDREFFLEAWNGDNPYSMDRIGRGNPFVEGLCLSVLGGLQPSKFGAYVESVSKGGKSDDGLFQRLQILLFPGKRKKWTNIDRKPNFEALIAVEKILEKIDALPPPERIKDEVQRIKLHFSEEAQLLADAWREALEKRLCTENMSPIFEAHISKYRSLMPSLALIFSLVHSFDTTGSQPTEVDTDSVRLAIKWCHFLEQHAFKAYGEYLEPEMVAARVLLEKIKSGLLQDFDRCRELYRRGWKGLGTQERFDAAIKTLQEFGWVRSEVLSPSIGRKSEIIRLHPSLRK